MLYKKISSLLPLIIISSVHHNIITSWERAYKEQIRMRQAENPQLEQSPTSLMNMPQEGTRSSYDSERYAESTQQLPSIPDNTYSEKEQPSAPSRRSSQSDSQWSNNLYSMLRNPIDTVQSLIAEGASPEDLAHSHKAQQAKSEIHDIIEKGKTQGLSTQHIMKSISNMVSSAGAPVTQWLQEVMYEHQHKEVNFNQQRNEIKKRYESNHNSLQRSKRSMLKNMKNRHKQELEKLTREHSRHIKQIESNHQKKLKHLGESSPSYQAMKSDQEKARHQEKRAHPHKIETTKAQQKSEVTSMENSWNASLQKLDHQYGLAQQSLNEHIRNQVQGDSGELAGTQEESHRKKAHIERQHITETHHIDSDNLTETAQQTNHHRYKKIEKDENQHQQLDTNFDKRMRKVRKKYAKKRKTNNATNQQRMKPFTPSAEAAGTQILS